MTKILKYSTLVFTLLFLVSCGTKNIGYKERTVSILKDSVLSLAKKYVLEAPITVTNSSCSRSEGGIHDFYSEGDYWWPDATDSNAPYIQKDGLTNPENFTDHRNALMRFSKIVGNLTSAYLVSNDTVYSNHAIKHLKAWFINEATKMNPNLLYSQAIKGRYSGRGIGIIDAIHLMEVVQSVRVLEKHAKIKDSEVASIRTWFSEFLQWLTTHQYGIDEMKAKNNHGTCWNMQVGLYAVFTKNDSIVNFCRENYKTVLLPNQMAANGSFPLEESRTKPYGYSLFNLDAMVMNCLILSDESTNLWKYSTADGRTIVNGVAYMKPYVENKSTWPYPPDVMYWENWPVGHPSFLFGGIYFNNSDYFQLWANKKHFFEVAEVNRNMPIRNPLIWMDAIKKDR